MTCATASENSLEKPGYVTRTKASSNWTVQQPLYMTIVEYCGDGDPMFGGSADDRPYITAGRIMEDSDRHKCTAQRFTTIEEAHEAAKLIPNRRKGSILGVSPSWREFTE